MTKGEFATFNAAIALLEETLGKDITTTDADMMVKTAVSILKSLQPIEDFGCVLERDHELV